MIKLIKSSPLKDIPPRNVTLPKKEGDIITVGRLYFWWEHLTDHIQSFKHDDKMFYITGVAEGNCTGEFYITANAFDHTEMIHAIFNVFEELHDNKKTDF